MELTRVITDQRRKMEDDKLRFQQHLEGSMADSLASHKADLAQQFAKQMAELQSFMQATVTSKDVELASAKVAIEKANAENRDAAGAD